MIGTVAVGVIIVDGPGTASFAPNDLENINAEVQEGIENLTNLAISHNVPHLDFIIDPQTVTLSLQPNTGMQERTWRDQAMGDLGYSDGDRGMYDYLHKLRTTKWPICPAPDWAYIAFFTKYETGFSYAAYATIGGPRLVVCYDPTGLRWGYPPEEVSLLFAHETGHIFGAPDEYPKFGRCSTDTTTVPWGYLRETNGNCEVINLSPADCLMRGVTDFERQICQYTVVHFGWRDRNGDSLPDPIDPADPSVPSYATDVGITPGTPFWNNADLWIRNQDDGETTSQPPHQNPRNDVGNYIYARVRNFGNVRRAEIVRVSFYLANYAGTEFIFPDDYTNLITAPDTPCPTIFCLEKGASAIAKVHLRPEQIPPTTWHPCLLVHVSCAQDIAVPAGSHVWDSNNLAQKNLVIDYVAPQQTVSLTVMAQNASAQQPFFEFKVKRVPEAAKLALQFRDVHVIPEVIEPTGVTPVKRWGRLFLHVPSKRSTKFKLPIRRRARKTIGLTLTAPAKARVGDEYQFELIQSNEQHKPTGGIAFVMRVVNAPSALKEQRRRTIVLRELGRRTGIQGFSALAESVETLIDSHLTRAAEAPVDPTAVGTRFSQLLREIAKPGVWGFPVEALAEAITRMQNSPGLATDLDVLSTLHFYAQERLLVDEER
jgi:hypothetical protein